MNDHELSAGLRALHVARTEVPDPPQLHQRVAAVAFDRLPQRRSWLPPVPRLTSPSMVGTTKFLVAGAIVALFGGFLAAGLLLQPSSEDPLLPAAASATSSPDAATLESSVRTDVLPGAELVTEEVAPGVHRVLSDGAGHDLTKNVWDVLATVSEGIWVSKQRIRDFDGPEGDPRYTKGRVIRLGDADATYAADHNWDLSLMEQDDQPMINYDFDDRRFVRVFDGGSWGAEERWRPPAGCRGGWPGSHETVEALGSTWTFCHPVLLVADEHGAAERIDTPFGAMGPIAGDDDQLWLSLWLDPFVGLAFFDGERWTEVDVEMPGQHGDIAVDGQGTLWQLTDAPDVPVGTVVLRSWDGSSWARHGEFDTPGYFLLDIVFDERRAGMWLGPLAWYDGTSITTLETPASGPDKQPSIQAASYDEATGSWWLAVVDGGDARVSDGLYVITPDAVARAE